jgi:hypothetical protein
MTPEKEIKEAIDRIARTADGEILYRYLQQEVCEIVSPANESALREHNGRRRFASDLMTLMGKGIDASGGRNGTERPVVFARHEPADASKRLSPREWLSKQPKWDDDPNFTDAKPDPKSGSGTS